METDSAGKRNVNYRILGKTGLRVSELGMGCSGIGRTMHRRDDAGAVNTLRKSLERGVNFFDTAPGYSAGESERLIGEAFKGKRDQIIIASKVGVSDTLIGRIARRQKHLLRPLRSLFNPRRTVLRRLYQSQRRVDFSRDFVVASLDRSLARLETDYLDILLLHHPTVEALRLPAFRDTFIDLKKAGKLRHWGVSADTLEQAMMSLEIPDIEVVQLSISMLSRKPLAAFLAHARKKNVGVVSRKVLEQGVLTGTKSQTKADWWTYDKAHLSRLKKYTEQLRFLETDTRTLTQTALLFVRGLEEVTTSVVGYSSVDHLHEIVAAYSLPLLTDEERSRIFSLQ
jgi:aryl-alcohol dehydrogenase-like predicted oxidoreductase